MTGHRLRAPQENRAILAEPPLDEVGTVLADNRVRFEQNLQFFDKPWQTLRQLARDDALSTAKEYMRLAGDSLPVVPPSPPLPFSPSPPLLLAGHQPELFHPGVWIKNFAIARIAKQHGAAALNIIIDSDTVKRPSLSMPPDGAIELDRPSGEGIPFEERFVADEEFFASLAERARPRMQDWPFVPILAGFWPEVVRQGRAERLSDRLAAARRMWERRWGCHNFEVPLSELCRSESFGWFVCHLLNDLPRFHTIYNQAVREYRRDQGIRSRNHPVPDLAVDGDWLEAPFWIWRRFQQRRDRLFVRFSAHGLELRQGFGETWPRPCPDANPENEILVWIDCDEPKIRPRALTTTLYARLLIADTFVHGIGGAKYDELTDILIRRFYGIEPPRYVVVSGTLQLPFPVPPISEADLRRQASVLRDCRWNPERHLQVRDARFRELAQRKAALIQLVCSTHAERLERFQRLRQLNEELRRFSQEKIRDLEASLDRSRRALAEKTNLTRRDFPFCFYPAEQLREFLTSVNALQTSRIE